MRPKKLLGCIDGRLQAVSERWCVVVEGKNQSILLLQQPRLGCFGSKPKKKIPSISITVSSHHGSVKHGMWVHLQIVRIFQILKFQPFPESQW